MYISRYVRISIAAALSSPDRNPCFTHPCFRLSNDVLRFPGETVTELIFARERGTCFAHARPLVFAMGWVYYSYQEKEDGEIARQTRKGGGGRLETTDELSNFSLLTINPHVYKALGTRSGIRRGVAVHKLSHSTSS